MASSLSNFFRSSKGISLITIIIIAALVVAAVNLYAYVNPDFQLSRLSFVYILRSYNDKTRKADLEKIRQAVEQYYDENGEYPAKDDWCGRIVYVMHAEVNDALAPYFGESGIPQDPSFRGTHKDYFYRREDRNEFVLLAVFENLPADSPTYDYEDCYDWPGDGVFNYRVTGSH
jgi:hypothetical protein